MPVGRGGFFFFFSSRRRHTRFKCDWSSDVCSSDLVSIDRYWLRRPAPQIVIDVVRNGQRRVALATRGPSLIGKRRHIQDLAQVTRLDPLDSFGNGGLRT